MKRLKKLLSVLMAVCMVAGMVFAMPATSYAAGPDTGSSDSSDGLYRIVHLDNGRKYFSVENTKKVIDTMAASGYNYLELAVGNDGMRFLLDDMSLTVGETTYASDDVKAEIQTGNKAYADFGTNELTQTEMDEIIRYANEKGIGIIPLINTPGHMDAILDAMTALGVKDAAYSGSGRTIDVTNEDAVDFTLAFVQKYIDYFAEKGCKIFNMGADEYANDRFTGGGMGFGQLQSTRQYGKFVEYVNAMAAQIKNAGMTPMAFNDGIYYNENTSYGTIDNEILIAYWSSGWSGYNVASASFLAGQGFDLINTNGDYYWIVGKDSCTAEKAAGFEINRFMGEKSDLDAAGAMFCIWCDYPGYMTEAAVVSQTADVIRAFGQAISESDPEEPGTGAVDEQTNISVTAEGITTVQVAQVAETPEIEGVERAVAYDITPYAGDQKYTGTATVSVPVPEGWDTSRIQAFVQEADGTYTQVNGTYADGSYTYTAPHFSVQVLGELEADYNADKETQKIELEVGSSTTVNVEGQDLTGQVDRTQLDTGIANVSVQKKDVTAANNWQLVTNGAAGITENNQYIIVNNSSNGNRYALTKTGSRASVTVADSAIATVSDNSTRFTFEKSGDGYYIKDEDGTYLYPNATYIDWGIFGGYWNRSLLKQQTTPQAVTVSGNSSVKFTRSVASGNDTTTTAISYSGNSYSASESGSNLYLFKRVDTEATINTEITFTGVSEGTTYVTVGNTVYEIVVEDVAPSNALTGNNLTVEYWITNSSVHETRSSSSASQTTISRMEASSAEGVAITDQVPETAYSFYDGTIEVHFWQAMRLDSQNHQSGDSGDDETADGTTFTRVRYHNDAWQYMTADGVWNYFRTGDQAVAYYMRHTEITTEITTAMKDWGYDPIGGTPDTSSGQGQVALTVAVVYPDNTVSPSESEMYGASTTIFNYWGGRDIGIIAPLNNSDYEVSKITVTDGQRDSNKNSNTWGSSDSITWEKVATDAGSVWYDETEVWNSSMGTEAVVNGKASNITWSAKNTAKLVLIYLQPVHHDSNLTVNWVDDSASGALINTMEVVVSYEGSDEITFINGLEQSSPVPAEGGTFTLDDDAYIVNSSGVEQTFNKDITVMNVDPQYRSGLYQYVSADISADGKTLTLHYSLNSAQLSRQYVVDFGLPVQVPLSDLVENVDEVQGVTVSGNAAYDSSSKVITYTPASVMNGTEIVTVRLSYGSNVQKFSIGFVPATTVYYEEGFATYSNGWKGFSKGSGTQQTAVPGQEGANQYGYDAKYTDEVSGPSNGTQAVSTAYGDTAQLTFTGTGIDIYTNSTPDTGRLYISVKNSDGRTVKVVQVETALKNGETSSTEGQEVIGYNVPVASLDLGTRGTYTVNISHMKTTAEDTGDIVNIDGYRVYGTLDGEAVAYVSDKESSPTYVELRDQVLSGLSVDPKDSQYAADIAEDVLSQVYSTAGSTAGAVLISADGTMTTEEIQDLLDNGPKNELYLRTGQSLTFKVSSANKGNVQIGLKALDQNVNYTLNDTTGALSSSTDMFYKLNVTASEEKTVTITNNGGGILSITKLKFPGTDAEPTTYFAALSKADLMPALLSLGFEEKPSYAEAAANVNLVDYTGTVIASTTLAQTGEEGTDAVFTADSICEAAGQILPSGYGFVDESAIADQTVACGQNADVDIQIGKVATLKVTYKTLLGRTKGTVTLTAVQTSSNAKHKFTAAELRDAAPGGYWTGTLISTSVKYGSTETRTVIGLGL